MNIIRPTAPHPVQKKWITKNKITNFLWIGSFYAVVYLFWLLFIAAVFGCNPAKQVMKNKESFDKVGEAWSKDHPCVNDTVTTILPGDTITRDGGTRIDTLYSVADGDTIIRTELRTRTVYKTVHDTLVKNIRDTRAEKVLQNELGRARDSLNLTTIQRDSFKESRNKWRATFFGFLALLGIGAYLFFRRLLRPKF